jgi:hypothetical protein
VSFPSQFPFIFRRNSHLLHKIYYIKELKENQGEISDFIEFEICKLRCFWLCVKLPIAHPRRSHPSLTSTPMGARRVDGRLIPAGGLGAAWLFSFSGGIKECGGWEGGR